MSGSDGERDNVSGSVVLPGWERHWDETRDVPFYVHAATGQSVWSMAEARDVTSSRTDLETAPTPRTVDVHVSQPVSKTCWSRTTAAVLLLVCSVVFVLLARPFDARCANTGRDDACPVHQVSMYFLLLVTLVSVGNWWFRHVPVRAVAAMLMAVALVGVVQISVTGVSSQSKDTAVRSSFDTGECVYVDDRGRADLPNAESSGLNQAMQLCGLSEVYVRVSPAWRSEASGEPVNVPPCGESSSSWTLLDALASRTSFRQLSQLSAVSFLLSVSGGYLWPETWLATGATDRDILIARTADAVTLLACRGLLPLCTDTCGYEARIADVACDALQQAVTTPDGESPKLSRLYTEDPSVRYHSFLEPPMRALGLDPAAILTVLWTFSLCVERPFWLREYPNLAGADQTTCVDGPYVVAASFGAEISSQNSTFYFQPDWKSNRPEVFAQYGNLTKNSTVSRQLTPQGNCRVADRDRLLTLSAQTGDFSENDTALQHTSIAFNAVGFAFLILITIVHPWLDSLTGIGWSERSREAERARALIGRRQWQAAIGVDVSCLAFLAFVLAILSLYIAFLQQRVVYALLYHIIGWLCLSAAFQWVFWYAFSMGSDYGSGIISKFMQAVGLHEFAFGGRFHLALLLLLEALEIGSQILNIATLSPSTDMWSVLFLTTAVSLNLCITSGLLLWRSDAHLAFDLIICDTIFDFIYLFVSITIRDLTDMDILSALVLVVPLLSGWHRTRTVSNKVAATRFRILLSSAVSHSSSQDIEMSEFAVERVRRVSMRQSISMTSPQIDSARRSATTEKPSEPSNLWRPRGPAFNSVYAILFAAGLVFLASTIARTAITYTDCEEMVGSTLWSASSPKALFEDGIFKPLSCGLQYVETLAVHDRSLDSLDVVLAYYTGLQRLDLSGCAVARVPSDMARVMPQLTTLDLSDNAITYVSPSVFAMERLKSIDLSKNPFNEHVRWDDEALEVLPRLFLSTVSPVVKTLSLRNTTLRVVPVDSLGSMPLLQSADFSSSSGLSEWPPVVPNVLTLRLLNLSRCALTEVPPWVFQRDGSWSNASDTTLDLSYNRLREAQINLIQFRGRLLLQGNIDNVIVPQFPGAPVPFINPEVLRLAQWPNTVSLRLVGFTEVPEFVASMTNVLSLKLTSNSISLLKNNSFLSLRSLQEISLENNGLSVVEVNAFAGLGNLTTLDLRNNELTYLSPKSYEPFADKASVIFLNQNVLTALAFPRPMPALRSIIANSNRISALMNDTLASLTSLTAVFLSENNISRIDSGAFRGLDQLNTLDLSFNPLSHLEDGMFNSSLVQLALCNSSITTLRNGTFSGATNISSLRLWGNPLAVIESGTFAQMTRLRSLTISSSAVSLLPPAITEAAANGQLSIYSELSGVAEGGPCECYCEAELAT